MKLRSKILLLAAVPLLLVMLVIAGAMRWQTLQFAQREKQLVESALLASKHNELRNYVSLGRSAITPLTRAAPSDTTRGALQKQALDLLAQMEFGRDGYFFVYDLEGHSLMHPRQPELVGKDLWDLRDPKGRPVIQTLLAAAREGGHEGKLVRYLWQKPSSNQTVEKLGYVTTIEAWGWMIGTGLYLDDIEEALARIDDAAQADITSMFAWLATVSVIGLLCVAACGLALNISDHRQADAKLRKLARQVVSSQEDERARLSRELHDGISQLLVSVKLSIEAARETLRPPGAVGDDLRGHLGTTLDRVLASLHSTVGEVRRISHDLRPALLDDLGLPAALQHLGREVASRAGQPGEVDVIVEGPVMDLPKPHNTALFRIAQEALTNVVHHARADRVTLTLRFAPRRVDLTIRDNGVGFDQSAVQRDPSRGIGLRNMRERAESLGGRFTLRSDPQGTWLEASLPAIDSNPATDPSPATETRR